MRHAFAHVWANPYVRVLTVLALFALLLYLLLQTRLVWISFFIAYLLAYTANPLILWLQRRRIRRWVGVVIFFILFLVALALVVFLFNVMAQQLQSFALELPMLLEPLLEGGLNPLVALNRLLPAGSEELILQALATLPERLEGLGETIVGWIGGFVGGIAQILIILVLTIYILLSFPHIGQSFLEVFPRRYRDEVARYGQDLRLKFDRSVGAYVRAQLVIAAAVGLMIWISLSFAGIPLAATWGIIGGVGNLIPFLGPIIASVPAVILAFLVGSWSLALVVIVIFILINQIDANVLSPLILAKAAALHPVTIVLSILVGALLFGLWGALLAVPAVSFLKLLYLDYYLASGWYKEDDGL